MSIFSKDFKEASSLQKSNEPSTSNRNPISASNPPMRKDGSLDYDGKFSRAGYRYLLRLFLANGSYLINVFIFLALYEEDEEQNGKTEFVYVIVACVF